MKLRKLRDRAGAVQSVFGFRPPEPGAAAKVRGRRVGGNAKYTFPKHICAFKDAWTHGQLHFENVIQKTMSNRACPGGTNLSKKHKKFHRRVATRR